MKNRSSISKRKKRQIFHVPFTDCIGNDGVMVCSMKRMFRHKLNVGLLGKNIKTTPRGKKYVKSLDGKAIMLVHDFMKKIGIKANIEMQFQYFIKSVSLGEKGSLYISRDRARISIRLDCTRFFPQKKRWSNRVRQHRNNS